MDWVALLQATVWLLIILDPIGNLPLFMAATQNQESTQRRRIFSLATLAAFGILLVFMIGGKSVLSLFRVTLADLQIAGGLLLLIIAVRIIVVGHESVETLHEPSIVPLACPLLAGPGAITATLVLQAAHGLLLTAVALVLSFAITWLVLLFGERLFQLLGKTGSALLAQAMGLLLATIAVQFIRSGIESVWRV